MISPIDVKKMIEQIILCEYVEVEGDGHHFFAKIISKEFIGLSRLNRHKIIKNGLKNKFNTNELHALSIISTLTPEEYNKLLNNFN